MDVKRNLRELITKEELVCLPGLGGFISKQVSAQFDPTTHIFTPPHKQLAFNDRLQGDGDKLANQIALNSDCSVLEAEQKIKEFVEETKELLKHNSEVFLEGIGYFFTNDKGISFKPHIGLETDPVNFGLPQILVKTSTSESTGKNLLQKPKDRKAMSTIDLQSVPDPGSPGDNHPTNKEKQAPKSNLVWLYVITPLVLLGGFGMFLGGTEDGKKVLASMHVIQAAEEPSDSSSEAETATEADLDNTTAQNSETATTESFDNAISAEETIKKSETDAWTSEPTKAKQEEIASSSDVELTTAHLINGKSGRCFIIVGGFANKKNAIRLREKLVQDGLEAKVIAPTDKSPLYRVSLSDYAAKDEALKKAEELKGSYGDNLWVMVY